MSILDFYVEKHFLFADVYFHNKCVCHNLCPFLQKDHNIISTIRGKNSGSSSSKV